MHTQNDIHRISTADQTDTDSYQL